MTKKIVIFCVGLAVAVGCGGGGGSAAEAPSFLEELHGDELSAVSPLPAFVGRGLGALEPEDVWLVRGEVSKSSLTRVAQRDVPATVEDARVPLSVVRRAADLFLLPLERLESESDYTIVALGAGELGRFSTNAEILVELERAGDGSVSPGDSVSFCALDAEALDDSFVAEDVFEEAEILVDDVARGCVRLRIPDDAHGYFPVPSLRGDLRLSPEPLWVARGTRPECASLTEITFEESGGFLSVAVPAGFSALTVMAADASSGLPSFDERTLFVARGVVSVGPLAPESDYGATLWHRAGACEGESSFSFRTGPPAPRFVLSEVFADPLGPEPASEWIEVRNIGSDAGSLGGYRLRDAIGEVELPETVLPAGAVALVVRADYAATGLDPTPASAAIPLVVPKLGGNGLSNSGEAVVLVTPEGLVVSTIPALPAESGSSWERSEPWAPDVVDSFVLGAPTPGW